jgi:hypothetical protein
MVFTVNMISKPCLQLRRGEQASVNETENQ